LMVFTKRSTHGFTNSLGITGSIATPVGANCSGMYGSALRKGALGLYGSVLGV